MKTWIADNSSGALALVIAILATLPYWEGAACGAFPWDDEETIARSAAILNGASSLWAPHLGNFHPLTMASWVMDQWIGGGDPRIYHITNILLHALNAALVFLLGRCLLRTSAPAAALALLFALHPIQVESVAWISERKNLLHILFYLCACVGYCNYLERGKKGAYVAVALLFIGSLLSKAQGVTLPLFLFGIAIYREGWMHWRQRAMQLLPLLCIAVLFTVIAISAQQQAGYIHVERIANAIGGLVLAATAFLQYPVRLLVPYDLSPIHPIPVDFPTWQWVLIVPLVLIIAWFVLAVRRRQRVTPSIMLMYLAAVLPIMQLVPFGSMITADRYAYLPAIPIMLAIIHSASVFTVRKARPWMVYAPLAVILAGMAYMTRGRVALWCEPARLFAQAVDRYPNSMLARANLAAQYLKEGRNTEARAQLEQALAVDPNAVEVLVDLAQEDMAESDPQRAVEHSTKAILLGKGYRKLHVAYYTRALAFKAMNRPDQALADLAVLLRTDPGHAKGWYQQGICFAMKGEHQQALASYSKAAGLGLADTSILLNQAISYGWLGNMKAAIDHATAYIELDPRSAEGYFLRGIARQRSGENGCNDLSRAAELGHARAQEALATYCGG